MVHRLPCTSPVSLPALRKSFPRPPALLSRFSGLVPMGLISPTDPLFRVSSTLRARTRARTAQINTLWLPPAPAWPAPSLSVRTSLRTGSCVPAPRQPICLVTTLVTACLGNHGFCCYSGCYSTQKMRCFVFTALFTRGREGATLPPIAGAVAHIALLFRAGAVTAPAW